jgi:hypothetical protein
MLFAVAKKKGVTGPDWTGSTYTYKNGEQRMISEYQRGYYAAHIDAFDLLEADAAALIKDGKLIGPTGAEIKTSQAPLRVSGVFQFNQMLTATLAPGWSANSYQWTRNGVDIAGATNNTYVLVAADIGKAITVKANGLAYAGENSEAVTYVGPKLYRFATSFNKLASNSISPASGDLTLAGRYFRPIGSSHKKSLSVSLNNWAAYMSANVQNGINVTLLGLGIEYNGITRPLTINGNPLPAALPDGVVDLKTDDLYPADFGVTRFARNTTAWLKPLVFCPVGGRLPISEGTESESVSRYWIGDAGSVSNMDGTGLLVFSCTTTQTMELPFIMIGEDEDIVADARCWYGLFDSIGAQGGPSSYFHTAMRGDNTNYIAACLGGKVGGTYTLFTNNPTYYNPFFKYANGTIEEPNTNSISSLSAASLLAASKQVWAQARANKSTHPFSREMHVMRVPLLVKTTDSTGATVADAGWNAGGKVEVLNDSYAAEVGQPTGINSFAANLMDSPNLMRRGAGTKGVADSDYYKWPNGRTGDGLHPNNVSASGTTGLGANLRPYLLAAA